MDNLLDRLTETVSYLQQKITVRPEVGLILGSGLGVLAEKIVERTVIPYAQIPHFCQTTVLGHSGQLVFGTLGKQRVMALQGRFHYYEGYSMSEVTYPIRVMQRMGIKQLIVTNAAGGLDEDFQPGDLMLITDHINLLGTNPLIGPNYAELGPRFPTMANAYDNELAALARRVAAAQGIKLQEGVYVAVSGPSYETAAELRMFRRLGASAVGMSTVPEVIVARYAGIRVLGISCITNVPLKELHCPDTHAQVVAVANSAQPQLVALVKGILEEM